MKAFITGINGQTASYLAEFLLGKQYDIYGLVRRSSHDALERLNGFKDRIHLLTGDITDTSTVHKLIKQIKPHEVYNLAAQSFVPESWNSPRYTFEVNTIGLLNILEAVREHCRFAKIYQASSSEMYGNSEEHFEPRSPYGIAKLASHHLIKIYRDKYNLFACSGIAFNHESPRRGNEFVTKKITNFVKNPVGRLHMGNLDSKRDWGFAGDYVEAMWLILQQAEPDDYVIATGESHSVREFLDIAFHAKNLDWMDYVQIDPKFMRKNEIHILKGDNEKIKSIGWEPKTSFRQLVEMMVNE